jgi:cob(I)alamin adenosyltransferase
MTDPYFESDDGTFALRNELRVRNERIAVLESEVRALTAELEPLRRFAHRLRDEERQLKGD